VSSSRVRSPEPRTRCSSSRREHVDAPGCSNVLNDNALCGDGRDWFGTFHGAKRSDWNGGTVNAVFVDCHVEQVRSGLQTDHGQATIRTRSLGGSRSSVGPSKPHLHTGREASTLGSGRAQNGLQASGNATFRPIGARPPRCNPKNTWFPHIRWLRLAVDTDKAHQEMVLLSVGGCGTVSGYGNVLSDPCRGGADHGVGTGTVRNGGSSNKGITSEVSNAVDVGLIRPAGPIEPHLERLPCAGRKRRPGSCMYLR
jgi:prepilin-type processing-associated H-X9-DG protein